MEPTPQFILKDTSWKTLVVGFMGGSFFTLLSTFIIIFSVIMKNLDDQKKDWTWHGVKPKNFNVVIRLYRGPLLIVSMLFLVGINIR